MSRTSDWANKVIERAGYKCEWCGTTEDIFAHHIIDKKSNPNKRYDINSGMCLCRKCHKEYHHWNKYNKY